MDDIKEQVIDFLSRKKFVTLATSSKNGRPLAHTVAYINIGPNIYFSTNVQSRKIKNIKENPNIAYSIYADTDYLDEIRSIQMEGAATIVSDKKESKKALDMLCQKFPIMANMSENPDSIIVKVTPKVCFFSDYIKNFGNREKVEF